MTKPFFPNKETKDISWLHIFDRTMIHLFSAGGVLLAALYAVQRFASNPPDDWAVALVCFTGISLREGWDIKNGNPFTKSVIDWASWAVGFAVWLYVLHRIV